MRARRRTAPKVAPTEEITKMLGSLAGVVGRTFDLMAIAEEELERAFGRPRAGSLKPLLPGDLSKYPDEVYRSHARELATRMAEGKSETAINIGTRAEVMIELMNASLKAPLTRTGEATYARIFAEVFPTRAREIYPEGLPTADWVGQIEEEIAAAQRRLTRDRCAY